MDSPTSSNRFEVGAEGTLEVDKLQFGAPESVHVGRTEMRLGTKARLSQTTVTAGGRTRPATRRRPPSKVPTRTCHVNGVYMPTEREHVDTSIRIEHNAPNCESNQFYKGILQSGGHGVFAGKIYVAQVAQKTNAYQQNDNLMLSARR